MAKAIILSCTPNPKAIGNVVEATFFGTHDVKGKTLDIYKVAPAKKSALGQEILFAKHTLAFLPPPDSVDKFDGLYLPTKKTADV